jgi:hypothetical protein
MGKSPHMAKNRPKSPPNASPQGITGARKNNGQDWPFSLGSMPEAMRAQTEALYSEQADLLGAMQNTMAEWMKRRRDASEAAFGAFERICGCTDRAEAVVAYNEWLVGTMNFFIADIAATYEHATRMTQIGQRSLSTSSPGWPPPRPQPSEPAAA